MTLLIIFFGLAVVYYLFQKNRINRIEKQEYLRERKNEKFEQLLNLARKQDAATSEEQDKNNNTEN
ncbi:MULTISPECIES: hypothetical protein [Chryseobacterium]|uniref:Uncharacterized protein n=1 Tax=Chryseobacterium gambrini TaxID=373672 RepID=A0A1N7MN03_9FLAO|nr:MULTISPECIES: hypothetical protein [Chryseobacterium]MCQ4140707.1 hypothetical protein [Chryseobacterium sp. EO14]SIS87331.1 hypothetical protein SAMN05421785_103345 [Chryseobacterium gambrini]